MYLPRRTDARTSTTEFAHHIEAGGARLLAVTHTPAGEPRAGVIMCSPVLGPQVRNHRREVILARELAQAGYAVQRLHHRASGDSEGSPADVTLEQLVDDSILAADDLFAQVGGLPVVVVGGHLGALVASRVAVRLGGAPLVLWAPVCDIDHFRREYRRIERLQQLRQGRNAPPDGAESDAVDVLGFPLHPAFLHSLEGEGTLPAAGRDRLQPPGAALVVTMSAGAKASSAVSRVEAQLRAAGTQVSTASVDASDDWWLSIAGGEESSPATHALVAVTVEWVERLDHCEVPRPSHRDEPRAPAAATRSWVEQPLYFSAGGQDLFGVLTTPTDNPPQRGLLVLSGAGYGFSSARNQLWARLARDLAADGFATFRFCAEGVGESAGTVDRFALTAPQIVGVDAALDVLIGAGVSELSGVGWCLGARSVLATNPHRISHFVLLSPPVHDGSLGADGGQGRAETLSLRRLLRRTFRLHTLRSLPDPEARRAYARLARAKASQIRREGLRSLRDDGDPAWVSQRFVDDIARAVAGSARVDILYGDDDRDLEAFESARTGRLGRVIHEAGRMCSVDVVAGPVHEMRSLAVQERVLDYLGERVREGVRSVAADREGSSV